MKGITSEVAGDPDILLAPDLEAGNILAKQLTFLANADSAGLVLGARVPIILTSRADSVRSRIASCAVAMLAAHARRMRPGEGDGRLRTRPQCRVVEPEVLRLSPARRRACLASGGARADRRHRDLAASHGQGWRGHDPGRRDIGRHPCAMCRRRSTGSPAGSAAVTAARACWASATASCTAARNTPRPCVVTPEVLADLARWCRWRRSISRTTSPRSKPSREQLPGVPQVACFDTSFHRGQPAVAELVPLPNEIRDAGVQRYGFHGLSYEYIASVLPDGRAGDRRRARDRRAPGQRRQPLRAQAAAERGQHPGLHRARRALHGHPSGLGRSRAWCCYLFQTLGLSAKEVETMLYKKSGLLGISGISNDMRDLLGQRRAERAAGRGLLRLPRGQRDRCPRRRARRRRRAGVHRRHRRELGRDPAADLRGVGLAGHRARPRCERAHRDRESPVREAACRPGSFPPTKN